MSTSSGSGQGVLYSNRAVGNIGSSSIYPTRASFNLSTTPTPLSSNRVSRGSGRFQQQPQQGVNNNSNQYQSQGVNTNPSQQYQQSEQQQQEGTFSSRPTTFSSHKNSIISPSYANLLNNRSWRASQSKVVTDLIDQQEESHPEGQEVEASEGEEYAEQTQQNTRLNSGIAALLSSSSSLGRNTPASLQPQYQYPSTQAGTNNRQSLSAGLNKAQYTTFPNQQQPRSSQQMGMNQSYINSTLQQQQTPSMLINPMGRRNVNNAAGLYGSYNAKRIQQQATGGSAIKTKNHLDTFVIISLLTLTSFLIIAIVYALFYRKRRGDDADNIKEGGMNDDAIANAKKKNMISSESSTDKYYKDEVESLGNDTDVSDIAKSSSPAKIVLAESSPHMNISSAADRHAKNKLIWKSLTDELFSSGRSSKTCHGFYWLKKEQIERFFNVTTQLVTANEYSSANDTILIIPQFASARHKFIQLQTTGIPAADSSPFDEMFNQMRNQVSDRWLQTNGSDELKVLREKMDIFDDKFSVMNLTPSNKLIEKNQSLFILVRADGCDACEKVSPIFDRACNRISMLEKARLNKIYAKRSKSSSSSSSLSSSNNTDGIKPSFVMLKADSKSIPLSWNGNVITGYPSLIYYDRETKLFYSVQRTSNVDDNIILLYKLSLQSTLWQHGNSASTSQYPIPSTAPVDMIVVGNDKPVPLIFDDKRSLPHSSSSIFSNLNSTSSAQPSLPSPSLTLKQEKHFPTVGNLRL